MEQAKGALASGASQIKGMTENVDLQKLMPYLLAGGAGAVGGAALTGKRKERAGETRGQYLTRILRNAVATGAFAGVGSYAAAAGLKKTIGKVDLERPITGKTNDQGPAAAALRGTLFGAPAAIASGGAVLAGTAGLGGLKGALGDTDEAKKLLMGGLANARDAKMPSGLATVEKDNWIRRNELLNKGLDYDRVQALAKGSPDQLQLLLGGDKTLIQQARRLGFNTHDPEAVSNFMGKQLKGVAHKAHTAGELPSLLLGRTGLRRAGRGAVLAGGALIPAVIGSLLTERPE
jgi:hypothetical protein